jgi:2-methylcitrate dehydratase PrpD
MNASAVQNDNATRSATALRTFAEWAAAARWEDLPAAIRERAALVLADDLAAIVAARAEPEVIALQNGMAASSGAPEASVFNGRGQRLDRYSAAVANGSAADWCELDEGYRRAMCHAGLYTVPALLAEGEASGATGRQLLRALAVGYEAAARVARAFSYSRLVLHPHGSLAAVGAAAAVAALRGVAPGHFLGAVSAAATLVVPGPFNHAIQGALVRNVWPGVGAWAGLRAVDWSAFGITGRAESLHDVYADAFGAESLPEELSEGLGRQWAIADGYQKVHACCQYSHSAVEATLGLIAGLAGPWQPGAIRRIRVDTHERGKALDNVHPATSLAAKFSLQHILATTAHFGHAGAEAFHSTTLTDPSIAALREKVQIGPYEPELSPPNDRPARVTWEMADSSTSSEVCLSARGGPDRPFAPEEIRAKIAGLTRDAYPAMPAMLNRLLALDAAVLDTPWRETVEQMSAGT